MHCFLYGRAMFAKVRRLLDIFYFEFVSRGTYEAERERLYHCRERCISLH